MKVSFKNIGAIFAKKPTKPLKAKRKYIEVNDSFNREKKTNEAQNKKMQDEEQEKLLKDFIDYLESESRQKEAWLKALDNPKFMELSRQVEEELKNQVYTPISENTSSHPSLIDDIKDSIQTMKQ